MRVAGTSFIGSLATQLNSLQAQQYQLQSQASTGLRVQAPEDDPAAMELTLNLKAESSRVAQYTQTISTLQDRANASYSAIAALKTISDRAEEIATQADGTKSDQDLKTMASEVAQMIQTAVQLMNTKYGDQYLFGGTASGQAPFVLQFDNNGIITGVNYTGNTLQAQNEIAEGSTVTVDVVGVNNLATGARGLISDSRYGADFFNHLISLQNHLSSGDTDAINQTDLPALKKDEDNIIYHIGNNGAVQTRLEAAAGQADARTQLLESGISNTSGADLAQTLTKLSQAQNAYQVALQSSATILQLQGTLLNYL